MSKPEQSSGIPRPPRIEEYLALARVYSSNNTERPYIIK